MKFIDKDHILSLTSINVCYYHISSYLTASFKDEVLSAEVTFVHVFVQFSYTFHLIPYRRTLTEEEGLENLTTSLR